MARYIFGLVMGCVIGFSVNDTLWIRRYQRLSDKCDAVLQQQSILSKELLDKLKEIR